MSTDRLVSQGLNEVLEAELYLGRDQSILDQPPFNQLLLNERLGSSDLFKDTSEEALKRARILVLESSIFYSKDANPNRDSFNNSAARQRVQKLLKPNKRARVYIIARETVELLDEYPFARDYLKLNWRPQYFNALGEPTHRTTEDIRSYVAYASNRLRYDRNSRFLGLDEELPSGFSGDADVNNAINPAKTGKIRLFLMKKSGALE